MPKVLSKTPKKAIKAKSNLNEVTVVLPAQETSTIDAINNQEHSHDGEHYHTHEHDNKLVHSTKNPFSIRFLKSFAATLLCAIVIWLLGSFFLLTQAPGMLFNTAPSKVSHLNYGYEQVYVKNKAGEKVGMWLFKNPNADPKRVILYLHGNAGRLLPIIQSLVSAPELADAAILAPTYPGFDESEGNPTPDNVLETADLSYDYITKNLNIEAKNIILFGHSLGATPATYLASKHSDIQKLVIVNAFSSVQSMCFQSYGIFCAFGGGILNTAQYAKDVKVPVRQFGYKDDKVVPYAEGQKLYGYFTVGDKKFIDLTDNTDKNIFQTHTLIDFGQILPEI